MPLSTVTNPVDLPMTTTDVLVVGAGPAGLMTALVLARRGLDVTIVDGKSGPTTESRAVVVHARSVELYAQLGLADTVLAQSWTATTVSPGRDTPLTSVDLAGWQSGDTPYPGAHVFEQSRNEAVLVAALAAAGVRVGWGTRLVDLVDEGPGVTALLRRADGVSSVRARWIVGADGARSLVRRLLDVPFDGVTDDATFWVADLHGLTGLPPGEVSLRFGRRTFLIAFPLGPDGHVRLVGLVDAATVVSEEVLARVRDEFGLGWDSLAWFSSYRVHHRVAARFRTGRVFLAGDAAHVHSPVGGQGMNTGLQDGHGLAHLLADVHHGYRTEAALDSYEAERRPVARTLVSVTDRAFGVIGRRGRGVAALRRALVGVVGFAVPRLDRLGLGRTLGGLVGQYRIHYHLIPAGEPAPSWAVDPLVGRRLPPVGDGANHDSLTAMTWQLHAYGHTPRRPEIPGWIDGPRTFPADPRGTLRPDRVYLVRPDGFVAAALPVDAGEVDRDALAQAFTAAHLTS